MRKRRIGKRKKIIILLVTLISIVSSTLIYTKIFKPYKYKEHMNLGNKYSKEEKYQDAVEEFKEAIKYNSKGKEARVELAKAYINMNCENEAVEELTRALYLEKDYEEFLKEILEILNREYPMDAYDLLNEFVNGLGTDNVSPEIREIIKRANENVNKFDIQPKEGTYKEPISIKINSENMKVGHSYYYTTDKTSPDQDSTQYKGEIEINKSTTLSIVAYNPKNESSKVIKLKYVIKKEREDKKEENKSDKDKSNKDKNDKNDKNKVNETTKQEEEKVSDDKDTQKQSVDKSNLKAILSKANKIYKNAQSGNSKVKYSDEAIEKLKKVIDKAQTVYDNKKATENEVDVLTVYLEVSIETFKESNLN